MFVIYTNWLASRGKLSHKEFWDASTYMYAYIYKIFICIFWKETLFWNRNWKCNWSATLGTSGDIHGCRVLIFYGRDCFTGAVSCSDKFDVDGNRSRCWHSCQPSPQPQLGWLVRFLKQLGEKTKLVYYVDYSMVYRVSQWNVYASAI